AVGKLAQVFWQVREFQPVASGAHFVKYFAETEKIGLGRARTFRWGKAFRPDKRARRVRGGDQADVSQFRTTIDEDDIRGFDIAMDQTVRVQMRECIRQCQSDGQTFLDGKALTFRQDTF